MGLINQETSHAQSELRNVSTSAMADRRLCPLALPPGRKRLGRRAASRNAICELLTRFLAWRAQQETLRLLSSLDAATLRDLGLTDIESAVYGEPQDRVRGYDRDWWRKVVLTR